MIIPLSRSICLKMPPPNKMNSETDLDGDSIELFDMNPIITQLSGEDARELNVPEGTIATYDWHEETGLPKSQYVLKLLRREVQYLSVWYEMDSLVESSLPAIDEDSSSLEVIAARREWAWKHPHKRIDFMISQWHEGVFTSFSVNGEEFQVEQAIRGWDRNTGTQITGGSKAPIRSISLRNVKPFASVPIVRQDSPLIFSPGQSLEVGIRQTKWGNIVDRDRVYLTGVYDDVIMATPKNAVGVIA